MEAFESARNILRTHKYYNRPAAPPCIIVYVNRYRKTARRLTSRSTSQNNIIFLYTCTLYDRSSAVVQCSANDRIRFLGSRWPRGGGGDAIAGAARRVVKIREKSTPLHPRPREINLLQQRALRAPILTRPAIVATATLWRDARA